MVSGRFGRGRNIGHRIRRIDSKEGLAGISEEAGEE